MFRDVKVFGRIVVCSIAALLLVSPRPSGGETNAFASVDASAASVVIATSHDEAQEQISGQISDQIPDQTDDRAHDDTQAPTKVAALDPAEPSIELPAVADRPSNQRFWRNRSVSTRCPWRAERF